MPLRVFQRARWLASRPFKLLQLLVVGFAMALRFIRRASAFLSEGARDHVWWVLVVVERKIAGVPTWSVNDCIEDGIQPRNDAERRLARADDRMIELRCECGSPKCRVNGKFTPIPRGMLMTKAKIEQMLRGSKEP